MSFSASEVYVSNDLNLDCHAPKTALYSK